jgi:hypothetical protein
MMYLPMAKVYETIRDKRGEQVGQSVSESFLNIQGNRQWQTAYIVNGKHVPLFVTQKGFCNEGQQEGIVDTVIATEVPLSYEGDSLFECLLGDVADHYDPDNGFVASKSQVISANVRADMAKLDAMADRHVDVVRMIPGVETVSDPQTYVGATHVNLSADRSGVDGHQFQTAYMFGKNGVMVTQRGRGMTNGTIDVCVAGQAADKVEGMNEWVEKLYKE